MSSNAETLPVETQPLETEPLETEPIDTMAVDDAEEETAAVEHTMPMDPEEHTAPMDSEEETIVDDREETLAVVVEQRKAAGLALSSPSKVAAAAVTVTTTSGRATPEGHEAGAPVSSAATGGAGSQALLGDSAPHLSSQSQRGDVLAETQVDDEDGSADDASADGSFPQGQREKATAMDVNDDETGAAGPAAIDDDEGTDEDMDDDFDEEEAAALFGDAETEVEDNVGTDEEESGNDDEPGAPDALTKMRGTGDAEDVGKAGAEGRQAKVPSMFLGGMVGAGDADPRSFALPLARIKRIMRMDPEVRVVTQDAALLISRATELFIRYCAREAYRQLELARPKRKTIQARDAVAAFSVGDEFEFLDGIDLHMSSAPAEKKKTGPKRKATAARPAQDAESAMNAEVVTDEEDAGANDTGGASSPTGEQKKTARRRPIAFDDESSDTENQGLVSPKAKEPSAPRRQLPSVAKSMDLLDTFRR